MSFKKLAAASLGVLLALSLSACAQGAAKSAANDEKTLVVGFDANFPPYGFKDKKTGEYVGFDLDLAAETAKRNGWKLVKQPIDWDSKDLELNSGTIDCIWNGFTMNGREKEYTWSDPYVENKIVFVTKGDAGINDFKDLAGKTVLVQKDSSGLTALKSDENKDLVASFAALTEVPDYNNAFMDLDAGAAQVVTVDIGVANYQLANRPNSNLVIMKTPLYVEKYAVGFKKGNQKLRDKVQASLNEMKTDGTFMKLAKKYQIQDTVIAN